MVLVLIMCILCTFGIYNINVNANNHTTINYRSDWGRVIDSLMPSLNNDLRTVMAKNNAQIISVLYIYNKYTYILYILYITLSHISCLFGIILYTTSVFDVSTFDWNIIFVRLPWICDWYPSRRFLRLRWRLKTPSRNTLSYLFYFNDDWNRLSYLYDYLYNSE